MSAEIENVLIAIAKQEKIFNYKIEKTDGSEKGDGYIGIITSIKITGKDEKNLDKILNLIVKSASQSDSLRAEAPIVSVFDREIYMYDIVFRSFHTFEEERGLPPSHFVPKFYKGQMAHKSEALVLENLKTINYKLFERRKPMDENHVELVMREYGRLHALSFALRDQNPNKFLQITERLTDDFVTFLKKAKFFNSSSIKAQGSLNSDTDKQAITAYKALISKLDGFFDELLQPADCYSVILHGDCWTNNMMFKYGNGNDATRPTEVCFLDFQTSRLGSPVLDLAYFFYTCSSKDIIDNVEHYMQLYYKSFSEYLRKLGSDPDEICPYFILEQHWKKYAKFGLLMASLTILAMFTEKDEMISLSDVVESGGNIGNAFNYEIANVDKYNDRMRHIILHHVKNKFI